MEVQTAEAAGKAETVTKRSGSLKRSLQHYNNKPERGSVSRMIEESYLVHSPTTPAQTIS